MTATWSQWTECLGSCVTSRRRVCSEQHGCNGLEYEEKNCENADDTCFQPLSDTLSENLEYCSMLENSKIVKSRNRRVVNGLAVRNSWDWIVRLEFLTDDNDLSSLCGGTVIHRNFVLTAAHCCIGKDYVVMNFKDKSRRNIAAEQFQLKSRTFFVHPEYGKSKNAQNFDICLIQTTSDELGVPEDLSPKFDSIPCLPDQTDLEEHHGTSCWVAGWGQAQSNGVSSDSLKAIGVNLFSREYCINHSFYSDDDDFILNEDELCAGLPHNSRQDKNLKDNFVTAPGKDACQGDSGGPLICSIDDKAVLVGVVSHGSGCGEAGKPGIYAKVDFFKDWFQSVMREPSFLIIANPVQKYHPMQMNFLDPQIKGVDFTLGTGTEAYYTCSTVLAGETIILGGIREPNQFSVVESCELKRKPFIDLPFTKNLYAQVYCGVFNFKRRGEAALICRHRQCFTFDGEYFNAAESTSFVHNGVKMTEYENEPFIVGDYQHNQIEFMHLSHEKWYTASPFPTPNKIFGYAPVSRPGKVFILGGCCHENTYSVSLFEKDEWSLFGYLKQGRINFMTITYGTDVMIIGGKTFNTPTADIELVSLVGDNDPTPINSETDFNIPNSMVINGLVLDLNDMASCQETIIDSEAFCPVNDVCEIKNIPDPMQYNLTDEYIYVEKEWGSLFYRHIGKQKRSQAKLICANGGDAVHLPIPRFEDENEFYRSHFADENLWLDVSNIDNDGLKTSKGHYFIKYVYTFTEETHVNSYNWTNFNPKTHSDYSFAENSQVVMTSSGEWMLAGEDELHDSVCIYNIPPDPSCSKCRDEAFCRFTGGARKETTCVCQKRFTGEYCEIDSCSHCQNGGYCQWNNLTNESQCVCPAPFYGQNCEISSILLLSGSSSMIINPLGENVPSNFNFQYIGDNDYADYSSDQDFTAVYVRRGCAAVFMNTMMYFGGPPGTHRKSQQVLSIHNCEIRQEKKLPFHFYDGSCGTFLEPTTKEDQLLLCFSAFGTAKECHYIDRHFMEDDDRNFNAFPESKYAHKGTLGLGNYRGKPFVTGCSATTCYQKTEILDRSIHEWSDGPDYPFTSNYRGIYHYSTTHTSDAVFIIGGHWTGNIVAEFKDNQWRRLADLKQSRSRHGSIMLGSETIIFGGETTGDAETEVWNFETGQMKTIEPTLPDGEYLDGIALYFVDAGFCQKSDDY